MSKSPLAIVKEKFGDKSKLVAALSEFTKEDLWVNRVNENKGLEKVANDKLLRLHRIFSEVKEKFGTRSKLIDAILELEKRTKDAGYRQHLEAHPVPRLFDEYRVASRRTKAAASAAKSSGEKPAPKTAKA